MDLLAQKVDGAVVLNAEIEGLCATDCRVCVDVGGSVHNWLMATGLRYLIVDLQDEKDICRTFLVELLQLYKRHRFPFLFAGVMDRPRKILDSYQFLATGMPIFITPEDAVEYLRQNHPALLDANTDGIKVGETVLETRMRSALGRFDEVEEPQDAVDI